MTAEVKGKGVSRWGTSDEKGNMQKLQERPDQNRGLEIKVKGGKKKKGCRNRT